MVIDDLWFGYAAVTELRMCVSASKQHTPT